MTEPLTGKEYAEWTANINAIANMHANVADDPDNPNPYNEMTTTVGMQLRLFATIDSRDKRITALEWLVRVMRGELKLSGKHDSNCGGHDGRPCDCPYGRVLDLTEADYPECPQ